MHNSTRPQRLGNRVRERRELLGLSQSELARRAGLPRQTVHQIEWRQGRQVTTVVALRLAEALGVDVSSLFFEERAS